VLDSVSPQQLKRSPTLWLAVLYGLGVTIGAGIYLLVGIAAWRSGIHAPLAFVLAALIYALVFERLTGMPLKTRA
jgi:amino acid transporter